MATTSDHKSALATLLRDHQERGEPFAFAGREDVIERIIATARQNYKKPIPGATFLISGAPGAGKTSLVRQILKTWNTLANAKSIFCSRTPDEKLAGSLWSSIGLELGGKGVSEIEKSLRLKMGGHMDATGGIGGEIEFGKASSGIRDIGISSSFDIHRLSEGKFKNSVILAIDEIQNVDRSKEAVCNLIADLHTQSDIPVLLLCAGLADSRIQLDKAKAISADRISPENSICLGKLTRKEARNAVMGGLSRIAEVAGVNSEHLHEIFTEELTERSDQWPRHITCYLRGVAKTLIEQDTPDLNTLDKSYALSLGDQERKDYYRSRVNSSRLPPEMIKHLYEEIGKGNLHEDSAAGLLDIYLEADTSARGLNLRKKLEAEGATPFEKALHAGLITLNQDMECEIPIPSMETYIKDRCGELTIGAEDITR